MYKRPVAQFVVKISKYCNLRCTYCYEYNELGNKERMSLDLIARMFENIARHTIRNQFESVSFVWHGGEPFLIPLEYYEAIGDLQKKIFGDQIVTWNVAQTNLTVLTNRHIEFLKRKTFFRGIGISFDVHGDQRVDTRGQLKTDLVLQNLQKLIDHQIPFGAIAVLARNTLAHVEHIYNFYDQLHISSRFLPFYMSADAGQIDDHAITGVELVSAFRSLFDEWIVSEHATPVDPIDEYIDYAVAYLTGRRREGYQKETGEYVFLVNLDGGVWGQGEAYAPEYQYGNLAREGFGEILTSKPRRRAIEEADLRCDRYCRQCPYFGACPGYFVSDCSKQQQQLLEQSGCPVREVIDHIVSGLERRGLTGLVLNRPAEDKRVSALVSL